MMYFTYKCMFLKDKWTAYSLVHTDEGALLALIFCRGGYNDIPMTKPGQCLFPLLHSLNERGYILRSVGSQNKQI